MIYPFTPSEPERWLLILALTLYVISMMVPLTQLGRGKQ